MRVSVEKLFSHASVDAPNVIADANNFSLVETHHGADTTLASYCSCWLKPLDMSELPWTRRDNGRERRVYGPGLINV
jgi:hypothetical protein